MTLIFERFHPLYTEHKGVMGWWVCDGNEDTEHRLPKPYLDEPCIDRDEAVALSAILNEENPPKER